MANAKSICACILVSFVFLLFLFMAAFSIYGKKSSNMSVENVPLNCYVCEARLNYPVNNVLSNGSNRNVSRKIDDDIEGCLTNPKYKRQCDPGQFCAVLHQKIGDVERVVRTCSTGGKLGCNSDVIDGIKEKACFCNTDLCIQIPFFYD